MSDKPCTSCPWLAKNQTSVVVAGSPQGGGWFNPKNLQAKWREVGRGGLMPCHATDSQAVEYGGTYCKAGNERICVGLAILAHREVTALMQNGGEYRLYKLRKGLRMTAAGLAAWAARLYYAGATLLIGGREFVIPKVVDATDVTVPWNDEILKS